MATELTAMVKPEVANKIYSNYRKGNPPFKPWKGMEGCAWFGYDGNPNAGSLEGKTIKVQAMIDMPNNVPVVSKDDLENRHTKIMESDRDYSSAEGKMWHEIGRQGSLSVTGLLSVHVGRSRFSSSDGKYLLVSNRALHLLKMNEDQADKLRKQLVDNIDELLLEKQNENERTHGKDVTVHYPPGISKAESELIKFENDIIKNGPPKGQVSVTRQSSKRKGKINSVWWVVEYDSYLNAKRDARRIYHVMVEGPRKQFKKCPVEFGEGGERWKYKDHGALNVKSPAPYGSYVYPG
jgi:hypothetical protein